MTGLTTTQREVWETLKEKGPMRHGELARELWPQAFCGECDREHKGSEATALLSKVRRKLRHGGYIKVNIDWEIVARDLDSLSKPCGPFGAGAGNTFEGDPPPNKTERLE